MSGEDPFTGSGAPGSPPEGQSQPFPWATPTAPGTHQPTPTEPPPPAGAAPSGPEGTPPSAPTGRSGQRRWLPWAVVAVVLVAALVASLVIVFGGSSSTATKKEKGKSGAHGALAGSYFTTSIQDSRLVFIKVKQVDDNVTGFMNVVAPNSDKQKVLTVKYKFTGTVSGSNLTLKVTPSITGLATVTGTASGDTISLTVAQGTTVKLEKGSQAHFKTLVKDQRTALLSSD